LDDRRSVLGDKAFRGRSVGRAEAAMADLQRLLESGALDAGTQARLREAIDATERMIEDAEAERVRYDGLFNALPDPISIIGADGTVLDLNAVVRGLEVLFQRTLGEHITLEVHCAHGLPNVLADRGQIEQVIMNLVINARDAMTHATRSCWNRSTRGSLSMTRPGASCPATRPRCACSASPRASRSPRRSTSTTG